MDHNDNAELFRDKMKKLMYNFNNGRLYFLIKFTRPSDTIINCNFSFDDTTSTTISNYARFVSSSKRYSSSNARFGNLSLRNSQIQ